MRAGSWTRAGTVLAAAGLLVAAACGGATSEGSRAAADACAEAADEVGRPWTSADDTPAASPASPFEQGDPWTPPYPQAERAIESADVDRDRVREVAAQPRGVWLTDPTRPLEEVRSEVAATVRDAASDGGVVTLVLYGVPLRDCGGESAGGAESGEQYVAWTRAVAQGVRDGRPQDGPGVAVVVEPDALAFLGRLPERRQEERLDLLRTATTELARGPSTAAYPDAGHSDWVEPGEMADRLADAGVAAARGFAVNVSAFGSTEDQVAYGRAVSPDIGWKPFVVDTGRNGDGRQDTWCNPDGAALGERPRSSPGEHVDAYLWVKSPAESDGSCRDDQPPAGEFWPEYADRLAEAAGW